MSKKLIFYLIFFTLFGFWILDFGFSKVWADIPPYDPVYPIVGTVNNGTDEAGNVYPANGKTVVFYKDDATYDAYNVTTTIANNKFIFNAFEIWPLVLQVGGNWKVAVVQGLDGWGAGPVGLTISGYGYEQVTPYGQVSLADFSEFGDLADDIWDALVEAGIIDENGNVLVDVTKEMLEEALEGLGLSDEQIDAILAILEGAQNEGLVLTEGGGPGKAPTEITTTEETVLEPSPLLRVWFGNRLYQAGLYSKEKPFIIASTPTVKVDINIDEPYTLASNIESYSIVVDPGTSSARTLSLTSQHMTQKVYAAGTEATEEKIHSFSLQYSIDEALLEGEHAFEIKARSSGSLGTASSVTQTATVEVMGGPLRIIGLPLAYPSPFSPSKNNTVTIQYQLSADANIDLYLMDPTGARVWKKLCDAGAEGGLAGVNKVVWTGRADQGYVVGNGIYVGTIIFRDDGRLLAKYKIAVLD